MPDAQSSQQSSHQCPQEQRSLRTTFVYLACSAMAVAAVALMPEKSPANRTPTAQPRAEGKGATPPCKACDEKFEFFVDPAGNDGFNTARRLLHELAQLETRGASEASIVASMVREPSRASPDLAPREDRWLASLAVRAASARLAGDPIAPQTSARLATAIEQAAISSDPARRFQAIASLGSVPPELRELPDDVISQAAQELRAVFDPRLLALLDDRCVGKEG